MTENTSLVDFQQQIMALWQQKAVVDAVKERQATEVKKLEEMKRKIMASMEEAEIEKQHIKGVGTVYRQQKFSWKVPKENEKREAFFGFLRDKGVFESMITVNSQTLNAFCKEELAQAVVCCPRSSAHRRPRR